MVEYNLTEQQWRTVRVLFNLGEVSAHELAEKSFILGPSLSRILAHLTSSGIIVRKISKKDQRVQNIRLSAKGKRLHDKVQSKAVLRYQRYTKGLGQT
ncbi:MAG: homoprotocatechuate degradation regulator HpaR [Lentisphaeria bacterium]